LTHPPVICWLAALIRFQALIDAFALTKPPNVDSS